MSGKHHETRPGQEAIRKSQISDEARKWASINSKISYNNNSITEQYLDGPKIEEREKSCVHFYTLSIMNETNKICFRSFKRCIYSEIIFHFLGIIFLGLPYLLMKWWPALKCRWLMIPCSFEISHFILAENSFGQNEILNVSYVNNESFGNFKKFTYRYIPFFIEYGTDKIFSAKDIDAFSASTLEEIMSNFSIPEKNNFFLGPNLLDLEQKSYFKLFIDEVAHPFNVFQMASIIIWLFEYYYLYAFSIFVISVISISLTLYETRTNNKKLSEISNLNCKVKILKDSEFVEINSSELAPGHIVSLDSSVEICPCDLILIKGDVIVDESMLSGESVPVSKVSINHYSESKVNYFSKSPSTTIYCGTKILRARSALAGPALGLVFKIGFETEKGQLIQSILFQKPINFNFYSDSMKYICILGIISIFGFVISLYHQFQLKTSYYYIISRALDLITVVVPPALPATMSIGTIFSLNRLKKKMIHCISPSKINVASKIDVFCFDKTGTLTEEGLDLLGIVPSGCDTLKCFTAQFSNDINSETSSLNLCMALCHSLQKIDSILVGDPLEVKMFESSYWILEENHHASFRAIVRPPGSNANSESNQLFDFSDFGIGIGILRCFDFCSELRRTSVLSKSLNGHSIKAYCKGSPESILKICDQSTVPANFASVLLKFSRNGFRVIGCAEKNIDYDSSAGFKQISRESVESKMKFLGFLIFENKIKKQSPETIRQLSSAKIKTFMVTGDNILTAICVSRSCGIVKSNERVFMPSSDDCIDNFIDYDSNLTLNFANFIVQPDTIVFACSGKFLKLLLSSHRAEIVELFIRRCRLFARMSPKDKKMLVEYIQSIGLTVGFCGDGANDCGALKAADIGISLSDSEASIAAPFSSNCKNISCVISVLLEGRASLATSFSCFKFMAMYSMIQFTSLILLYCFGSSLGDNQFVYIDLILILPLGMLMSRFQPSQTLSIKHPETKLISPSVLVSLLSQIFYQAVAQIYIYSLIIFDIGHQNLVLLPGSPNTKNSENTVIFLLSIFLYLFSATLFCSWKPFRSFYIPFYFYVLSSIIFTIFIIFAPIKFGFNLFFELVPISFEVKNSIIFVAVLYFCIAITTEIFKPRIIEEFVKIYRYNIKRNKS